MPKTANLNVRIDPDVKKQAEELFADLGITISDAVNMFIHQALIYGGLPFDVKLPDYNVNHQITLEHFIQEKEQSTGQDTEQFPFPVRKKPGK